MVRTGLCLLLVFVTACGGLEPAPDSAEPAREGTPTTHRSTTTVTTVPATTSSSDLSPGKGVTDERHDPAGSSSRLTGPIVEQVLAAAADEAGQDPDAIEIVSTEDALFRDGSMGCPEKGHSYIQVLTSGWVVMVDAGESQLEYHVSEAGDFVLCP